MINPHSRKSRLQLILSQQNETLLNLAQREIQRVLGPMNKDVQIDWRQYFLEFNNLHGGDPIDYQGKLLYQDGWTYSRVDYMGPEWPPPEDPAELKKLRLVYWLTKADILDKEVDRLVKIVEELESLQRTRSAPLQQAVFARDDDGVLRKTHTNASALFYRDRILNMKKQAVECKRKARAIAANKG